MGTPPSNLEAELAILGGLLLDPDSLPDIVERLRPYHFYRENNGQIYQAFLNLYMSGEPIDHITVAVELERMEILNKVGGRAYLAALPEQAITARHVAHYTGLVLDAARHRKIIQTLRRGIDKCESGKDDSQTVLNYVTHDLFDIALEDSLTNGIEPNHDAVAEAIRRLHAIRAGNQPKDVLHYPWPNLDKLIRFRPGEVTVVAGRPSMGKSALAINLASHFSIKQGLPVGIFSLEMPVATLMQRIAAELSGVSTADIENGHLDDDDFRKLVRAYETLGNAPLYFDDASSIDEATLIAKARAAKQKYNIRLFVLDYLQLMEGKGSSDNEKVGGCAKTVRKLARHLRTPFIEVCQLSRAPEGRPNRRPILSDLRDSGNIEQEADVVVGLYRDDYYHPDNSQAPNQCEALVLKHRNGLTGTALLYFDKKTTTFKNLELHRGQNND